MLRQPGHQKTARPGIYIVSPAARGQLGIYGPRERAINNIDSRARSARVINVYLSHEGRIGPSVINSNCPSARV